MITFRPVQIGSMEYNLKELIFENGIRISAIDKKLDERRLTEFLKHALVENVDPLAMSIQHRYFLLLKYLEQQKQDSLLSINNIVFPDFYLNHDYIDDLHDDGKYIRQLTGRDLEFIEINCISKKEKIACAIAIQLGYDDKNILPPIPDKNLKQADYEKAVTERIAIIRKKTLSDFDSIYDDFINLSSNLMNLVSYAFTDDGITLRGTDDALYRFCPLIGISRFFK